MTAARCPPTRHRPGPPTCPVSRPPTSPPWSSTRCATRDSSMASACSRPGSRWNCTSTRAPSTDRRWCSRRRPRYANRPRPWTSCGGLCTADTASTCMAPGPPPYHRGMSERAELTPTAVATAAAALRSVVRETPVERSERLSHELGTDVWLKREDLQIGRSYKVRGAYNVISSLTPSEQRLGVTCASAGNHAQGVAFSCRALGIHGRVFVPTSTPRQKRDRINALGRPWVELVLAGSNY